MREVCGDGEARFSSATVVGTKKVYLLETEWTRTWAQATTTDAKGEAILKNSLGADTRRTPTSL